MPHRFKVGETLELRSAARSSNRPSGPCDVVTCLPHDRGAVLYRVRSWRESIERVVEETDLSPTAATRQEPIAAARPFSIAISKR